MKARQYKPVVDAAYVRRYIEQRIVADAGGCWVWQGALRFGYARARVRQLATPLAHRASYEAWVGPIPEGLTLDHLCRNTSCVNPAHLEPVPLAENIRRAARDRVTCRNGHLFTERTTYFRPDGQRECRECHRLAEAARKRRAA